MSAVIEFLRKFREEIEAIRSYRKSAGTEQGDQAAMVLGDVSHALESALQKTLLR